MFLHYYQQIEINKLKIFLLSQIHTMGQQKICRPNADTNTTLLYIIRSQCNDRGRYAGKKVPRISIPSQEMLSIPELLASYSSSCIEPGLQLIFVFRSFGVQTHVLG